MYKEILDKMRWSFSSVNSFNNCKRCFYLTYINKKSRLQNAFAEWGSFGHSLLERYYKGELEFFELSQEYLDGYEENVREKFPPNAYCDLGERYFEAGLTYFNHFEGLPEQYVVLDVEAKITTKVGDYPFVGFADLIIKDTNDDGIIIIDHKSKSKFKNEAEQNAFLRQLYLYALYVKEKYGVYPKELRFNMFRANQEVAVPFNEEDFVAAQQWFIDTVDAIYHEQKFLDKIIESEKGLKGFKKNDFFCNELCGVRESCPRSMDFNPLEED